MPAETPAPLKIEYLVFLWKERTKPLSEVPAASQYQAAVMARTLFAGIIDPASPGVNKTSE
jgi:hypothetical protein